MVALDGGHQVELDTTLDGDVLVIVGAVRLGAKLTITHASVAVGREGRQMTQRRGECTQRWNDMRWDMAVARIEKGVGRPPLR